MLTRERFLKIILLFGILASLVSSAQADQNDLQSGILNLFNQKSCVETQCLSSSELSTLVTRAMNFKQRFEEKLASSSGSQNIEWKDDPSNFSRKTFTFKSLVQRPEGHLSNLVHGVLYTPKVLSSNQAMGESAISAAPEKLPATLIIHRIIDDIRTEEFMASFIAGQNRGSVMIIYLPHYGPRKNTAAESFITENPDEFSANMLQALLDIHRANEILKSLSYVDSKNIGLMGMSLGGIITLISAGIEPIFDRYLTVAAGGDLAHTMSYKYRNPEDKTSGTALALKKVTWTTDEARKLLSSFDPITWAGNLKNKKIIMINSNDDELLDFEHSITSLFAVYKSNNSSTALYSFSGGGHNPDLEKVGFTRLFTDFIFPITDFGSGKVINKK